MALNRNAAAARQSPLELCIDIAFGDPAAAGVAENIAQLPQNAIVTGGDLTVTTAWNSTTNTFTLGDAGSANRYANAVDLKTLARTALTLTGYKHTVGEWLKANLALTGGAPTAGAARLRLTYIVQGRSTSNQG